MPGKKGNRPWVMMYCQELRKKKKQGAKKEIIEVEAKCNAMNYVTEKNKRNTTEKLELKKYCSLCKAKTAHIEGKNK